MRIKEPALVATVCASHRATIKCKFYPNARTIRVSRFDSLRDKFAIVTPWDDALEIQGNYVKAVAKYLARMNWGGQWVVSQTDDGAVAVCLDAVTRD